MLRFGTKNRRPARSYSSWRKQLRLLSLFVPLALVVLVIGRLRDPKTVETINAFFTPPIQESAIKPRPVVADLSQHRSPEPYPGIRPDLLKTIEDNTYFRTAEKDAWFHFIELMQKENGGPTHGPAVEYAQLVDQPDVYRGKLVTVRGTARQITQETPAENELGISSYYRVVIQPADGANLPIIVYCLKLPNGVRAGNNLAVETSVTGLFFKKLSDNWGDGLGIAPVIIATHLDSASRTSTPPETSPRAHVVEASTPVVSPADGKVSPEDDSSNAQPTDGHATIQKILTLAGWGVERLARFDEGVTLSDEQRLEALGLLRRLRSIDFNSLDDWYETPWPAKREVKIPEDVRGVFQRLFGVATKVTRRKLDAADAERLEMPEYYECEFMADNLAVPVTILTARVPSDWLSVKNLREPATAKVLFLKQITGAAPRTYWLANEIAWHPVGGSPFKNSVLIDDAYRDSRDPLFGKSLLGLLRVDVGQLDLVESRGRIRPQERDIFYHSLDAAGKIATATLIRIANDNLPAVKQQWAREQRQPRDRRRHMLAREIVRRADAGQYSAALLFNDPEEQVGRLFAFDGVARRAVRVEVAPDIQERFGIDHYYELEVFTTDSQNYPLIFCVRELPTDFPVGPDIRVPVRVAGFFFKNWLYSTRGRDQSDETADAKSVGPQAQFAPLLIGHAPIVLEATQPVGHAGRFVLGGLFLLALAGFWAAAAWFARDERRFRQRTPAANFALPAGQSLNDLNLPAADVPMTTEVAGPPADQSSN